ncbi:MAG: hypothetical protein JW820_15500 [Spirochaetales bacterium]|nr:hypothetical protein [Spirochaetales bacterium]
MNALEGLTNPNWLIFALLFLGIIFYLAYMRQRETKRILQKFKKEDIVITSFGVNFFGLESEPGGPLRSAGVLVLLRHGLYYRARFASRDLFIPGPAITYIGVTHTHKRKDLHQTVVLIQFLTEEGIEDKAAFRIPYAAQWVAAIKANLLEKNPHVPSRRSREDR